MTSSGPPQPGPQPSSNVPPARTRKYRIRRKDWRLIASVSPGAAALVAVVVSIFVAIDGMHATDAQLRIAEQGQITDRYNAAIANLGSASVDIRLGGIYALQRIMRDSPRDQLTVVAVLCAFVRDATPRASSATSLPTDVQAALTVVGTRNIERDGRAGPIDLNHASLAHAAMDYLYLAHSNLSNADLAGASLSYAHLSGSNLSDADIVGANLLRTHLAAADLSGANLANSHFTDTDLTRANLLRANLTGAVFAGASLTGAVFVGTNLTGAVFVGENMADLSLATATLTGANLTGANLTHGYLIAADLVGARFTNADLAGADFTGANLTGADMREADLAGADLSYANLAGASFYLATLTGANLTGANLTRAYWPQSAAVPKGWQRNPDSGRLGRTRQ